MKDFEVIKELGKGAFAAVSLVKRKEDKKTYALKRVKITQMTTKERENALNEVRLLASVQHVNIIGYRESFFDEESKTLNIVMEYADDGDLDGKIKNHVKSKTNIPENEIWSILIQITQGIKALHDYLYAKKWNA
jgi:NIMA (never in mitosis gene a)-related kinase